MEKIFSASAAGRMTDGSLCNATTWYHLECLGIKDIADLGREEDPWYCHNCVTLRIEYQSQRSHLSKTKKNHLSPPARSTLFRDPARVANECRLEASTPRSQSNDPARCSTLRQRRLAACALGPASTPSVRRPSRRSAVRLCTLRHRRTATVLHQTMLRPPRVHTACYHTRTTRSIGPHHGCQSWHRNASPLMGRGRRCARTSMDKTRQFHLEGRERNGRVRGGDDWIHSRLGSLELFSAKGS